MKANIWLSKRLVRFAFAVLILPVLLTGCAERLPKVGEQQKVGVTLPFKAEAGGVKLKISVGTVKAPILEAPDTRGVFASVLDRGKAAIAPELLIIPEGKTTGEVAITITKPSYAGAHFLVFFDEEVQKGCERPRYQGVTSLTVAPAETQPQPQGRYRIQTTSSTWIGPKRR